MRMKSYLVLFGLFLIASSNAWSLESLSYSGRLVNANGSPVTGPVNLKFDLSYTDDVTTPICTKTINGVALSNGVFHVKLDYLAANCGGDSITQVLSAVPVSESAAIRVTDLTN